MRSNCKLVLSNGNQFEGELIGAPLHASGELVFTTGMVGYSESITDPSYFGQILTFSYPLIGNYGIPSPPNSHEELANKFGFESMKVHAAAVIITADSVDAFHWNSVHTLDSWLEEQNVPGIVGIDTRHLVHLIRTSPGLLAKVVPSEPKGQRNFGLNVDVEKEFLNASQHQILPQVSTKEPFHINGKHKKTVAVIDCGVKWNILRQLAKHDCNVTVVPWDSDFSKVECDGWLISNGPGDPMKTGDLVERIKPLLKAPQPILGICLGHQLLSLAIGAKTQKMDYGHRSHNQPVYLTGTRTGFITSQNHGYNVTDTSLPDGWEVWFRNVNDQSVEGIRNPALNKASVQFHPESAGGPRDTGWIIEEFVKGIRK